MNPYPVNPLAFFELFPHGTFYNRELDREFTNISRPFYFS
jgi:hypothetical protein